MFCVEQYHVCDGNGLYWLRVSIWKESYRTTVACRYSASVFSLLGNVFQGVYIHIVPTGIGNARCDIFQQQIVQNGGQVEAAYSPACTHVVVDESVDRERALRLLKMETFPPAVQLVKCTWLSACISEKQLLSTEDYRLHPCDRYF